MKLKTSKTFRNGLRTRIRKNKIGIKVEILKIKRTKL